MKTPRNIVVKTLLNADEFLALEAECQTSDVSHSKLLRDLVRDRLVERQRNNRRLPREIERSSYGHIAAMLLPSRATFGTKGMSLRL